MVIHIFKYLNPADRLEASQVCIKWFEIFTAPSFMRDFYLNFSNCSLSKFESPASIFMNSLRNYTNLYLRDLHSIDEDFDEFWVVFGPNITNLVIKNCSCIPSTRFQAMIRNFVNLRSLKLYGEQLVQGNVLKHITFLDLTECSLDKEDAENMIIQMEALEKLRLNWDTVIDIENVARNAVQRLTIAFLRCLSAKKDILKLDLILSVPFFSEEILIELSKLANIRLNQFVLKTSGDIPIEVFKQFFEMQSSIEELELQNSRALTQVTLDLIIANLKNLKHLSLPNGTPYFETPLEIIQGIDSIKVSIFPKKLSVNRTFKN